MLIEQIIEFELRSLGPLVEHVLTKQQSPKQILE